MSNSSDTDARPTKAFGPVSLYVHVPFCLLKCAYCDFHSMPVAQDALSVEAGTAEHFTWAVGEGAAHWTSTGALEDIVSVYVGGGTPTTLGEGLPALIDQIRSVAPWREEAEVTVETNPDTTDADTIGLLLASGVNRFSLGVQSFDDHVLGILGRSHDAARAWGAAADLVATGARVSLDLMCGVPGQGCRSWKESLERAVETGAGHVSVYPLTVEESTPFAAWIEEGKLDRPDPDVAAEMMEIAQDVLEDAGLHRYEIANHARAGEESVHNRGYWTGRPFLGLGPSAASMMPVDEFAAAITNESWNEPSVVGIGRTVKPIPAEVTRVRFTCSGDTEAFVRDPMGPPEEVEYLTASQAAAEDAMLGLRLTEGICEDLAEAAGAGAALAGLTARGLVEHEGARWRISRAGWLLGNEVFGAVWNAGARRGLA